MRLLNVTTKRLESFYGNNIPRYAILSHMWGKEEDEVLFKHVAGSDDDRLEGESRKGFAKLLGACEQAMRDEWKYIWIDTCCIDKQSSAELSEAINSMYTWYQESEVCYAYLEDVQGDTKARGERNTTFETVPFEKSRWFSRGWTLQELIAPRRLVFYSCDWIDIGTKASLRNIISFVADIRVEMIMNYDPDKASVAEKMSWAAKRQTTRDEDIAYCLMGLLGVNMPLLYGEGTRAFRRLQEEIMKVSDDHSIFAWKIAYRRYSDRLELLRETRGMLAESPSDFFGARNIARSSDEGPYSAYSMSNKGLQIGLPIQPINPEELIGVDSIDSQNIFKAILDCTYRDTNPTRWVVIYLKMVRKGRYVRIFPYWLDATKMNPNEADRDGWVVTSLLVPQVNTSTINLINSPVLLLKILPTPCGYSYKGKSLVKGWASYETGEEVFTFDREGKHFVVVVGLDNGILWIDIISEDELSLTRKYDIISKIESSYEEGGSRYYMVLQHLNSLCVNVSNDHSVDVSGKLIVSGSIHGPFGYELEVTIDIRRITIQVPLSVHINDDFLDDLDPRNLHPNFKKEGVDWFAIFNSKVKRVLDVSPVHSIANENTRTRLVFSPDGKYLSAATSSTVRIFNVTTGGIICVLSNKSVPDLDPRCVCFSPNGDFLATGTHNGYILLWDVTKKYLHRDFTSHRCRINVLRFSPDSRFIISVPEHGMVRILDIDNGTSKDICNLGHEELFSAALSLNYRLVAGAHEAAICIWNLQTMQLVGELQGHNQRLNSVAFTPDGKGLVSGGDTLKYWDISRLTASGNERGKEHSNNVWDFDTSRAPSVTVGKDVDRSSQCIMDISHKNPVSSVVVSHDGKWIISVSQRGHMQFWDSRDGTLQFMLQNRIVKPVRSFSMSPVGNTFATNTGQDRVQIWKYNSIGH